MNRHVLANELLPPYDIPLVPKNQRVFRIRDMNTPSKEPPHLVARMETASRRPLEPLDAKSSEEGRGIGGDNVEDGGMTKRVQ